VTKSDWFGELTYGESATAGRHAHRWRHEAAPVVETVQSDIRRGTDERMRSGIV
jgi:hypothetical protein